MGGLTSFASQAFQVLGAVNTAIGAVNQYSEGSGDRAYDQQKQLNAIQTQNAQNQAALANQKAAVENEQAETIRRSALKRAMAKRKALYGSSGTGSSGGSAQAVLLGLADESQEELDQRNALDAIRKASLDEDVAGVQRINTLQLSQLKERDKYNRYTSGFSAAQTIRGLLD